MKIPCRSVAFSTDKEQYHEKKRGFRQGVINSTDITGHGVSCCVCNTESTYDTYPLNPPLGTSVDYIIALHKYDDNYYPVHRRCLEMFMLLPILYIEQSE